MTSENQQLAPVAIFVYNRLDNTREVIEALQKNYLAPKTDIFIFSDGPKDQRAAASVKNLRHYLRSVTGFQSVTVVERETNYYIEKNIIDGVSYLTAKYGRVIVLEDDGVPARNFLSFMNQALDFYESRKKIMHIASFTVIKMPDDYRRTIIWRYPENTGGGWATWKDRWEKFKWFQTEQEVLPLLTAEIRNRIELDGTFKCLGSLKAKPIPWDICWYAAIALDGGLAVNSPRSLIRNNGLYNGTHFTGVNRLFGKNPFDIPLDTREDIIFEDDLAENLQAINLLKAFYRSQEKSFAQKIVIRSFNLLAGLYRYVKRFC